MFKPLVDELRASEANYTLALQALQELHRVVDASSVQCVAPLLDAHAAFAKDLEQASTLLGVGNAFLRLIPAFKHYAAYYQQFESFSVRLERVSKDQLSVFPDVPHLRNIPVQRIEVYTMKMQALRSCDAACSELSRALLLYRRALRDMSELRKSVENVQRITELAARLQSLPFPLLKSGRKFLAQLDTAESEGVCFVFSDLVLVATQKLSTAALTYSKHAELTGTTSVSLSSASGAGAIFAVQIGPSLRVACVSREDAQGLVRMLHSLTAHFAAQDRTDFEQDVNADAFLPVTYEGHLEKLSSRSLTGRFTKKFVQLRGNTLFWFDDRGTPDLPGMPTGTFRLHSSVVVTDAHNEKGLPHAVRLTGPERTYWLRGGTRYDVQKLLRALESCPCVVEETLRQKYLGAYHGEVELICSTTFAAANLPPNVDVGLCIKVQERGHYRRRLHLGWGDRMNVLLPVNLGDALLENFKLCVYLVAKGARESLIRGDYKSSAITKCGSAAFSLSALLCRDQHGQSLPLSTKGVATHHIGHVCVGQRFRDHTRLKLGLSASGLKAKQNVPVFVSFCANREDGSLSEVFQSDTVPNSTSSMTMFAPAMLDVENLCRGDLEMPFTVQVYSMQKEAKLLGQVKLHMQHVIKTPTPFNLALSHPGKADKGTSAATSRGFVSVNVASTTNRYSLAHYILGGLQLRLWIGVDFSSFNRELHSERHDIENDSYLFCLTTAVSHFLTFFPKAKMLAWGTSAAHAPVFELGGTAGRPEVSDLHELLTGYKNARAHVGVGDKIEALPFFTRFCETAAACTQADQTLPLAVLFVPRMPSDLAKVQALATANAKTHAMLIVHVGASLLFRTSSKVGALNIISLNDCRGDTANELIRSIFGFATEQMESMLQGIIPRQYFGREPATIQERSAANKMDFSTPSGAAPVTPGLKLGERQHVATASNVTQSPAVGRFPPDAAAQGTPTVPTKFGGPTRQVVSVQQTVTASPVPSRQADIYLNHGQGPSMQQQQPHVQQQMLHTQQMRHVQEIPPANYSPLQDPRLMGSTAVPASIAGSAPYVPVASMPPPVATHAPTVAPPATFSTLQDPRLMGSTAAPAAVAGTGNPYQHVQQGYVYQQPVVATAPMYGYPAVQPAPVAGYAYVIPGQPQVYPQQYGYQQPRNF